MWAKIKKNLLFLGANVGNYRPMFSLFRLFKKRYRRLASDETAICIEGFPRSGNSYFVSVFQYWNKDVNIAHHSHLAGSLKYAIDRNCPAVVLIRKPEDAVASALAWDGLLNVNVALLSYYCFYESLWKSRDNLVFLRFDDAVRHPDRCIELISKQFEVGFRFCKFTADVDQRIRNRLKKVNRQNKRSELNTSLPNPAREAEKQYYIDLATDSCVFPICAKLHSKYSTYSDLASVNGVSQS